MSQFEQAVCKAQYYKLLFNNIMWRLRRSNPKAIVSGRRKKLSARVSAGEIGDYPMRGSALLRPCPTDASSAWARLKPPEGAYGAISLSFPILDAATEFQVGVFAGRVQTVMDTILLGLSGFGHAVHTFTTLQDTT